MLFCNPFPMFSSDILTYDDYEAPEISWLDCGSKERVQELVPTDTILLSGNYDDGGAERTIKLTPSHNLFLRSFSLRRLLLL